VASTVAAREFPAFVMAVAPAVVAERRTSVPVFGSHRAWWWQAVVGVGQAAALGTAVQEEAR